jgi:cold shock CspA family protein
MCNICGASLTSPKGVTLPSCPFCNADDATANHVNPTSTANSIVNFGGFEWRVLDVKDGWLLLLTEKIVVSNQPYNERFRLEVTWETCSLRNFLNANFPYRIRDEQERAKIGSAAVTTKNNARYGTNGGNTTNDRVFLLSIEEVIYYLGDGDKNPARIAVDSNGAMKSWWLRTPGKTNREAVFVEEDGTINYLGTDVNSTFVTGVRPAIWINTNRLNQPLFSATQSKTTTSSHSLFMKTGVVKQLEKDIECNNKGWGLISVMGEDDVYFNLSHMQEDDAKKIKMYNEVCFEIVNGAKGPQASNIVII